MGVRRPPEKRTWTRSRKISSSGRSSYVLVLSSKLPTFSLDIRGNTENVQRTGRSHVAANVQGAVCGGMAAGESATVLGGYSDQHRHGPRRWSALDGKGVRELASGGLRSILGCVRDRGRLPGRSSLLHRAIGQRIRLPAHSLRDAARQAPDGPPGLLGKYRKAGVGPARVRGIPVEKVHHGRRRQRGEQPEPGRMAEPGKPLPRVRFVHHGDCRNPGGRTD